MYKELDAAWTELTQPGQMFEVDTVDALGRTIKTFKHAPASLRDIWLLTAAHGDKDHLVYQDERWTYTEAHNEVAAIAAWLTAQGIGQHDRVAIAMRNYPEWMLAYWAIISIGAVAVGMNAWWVPDEMKYGLEDSDVKVLIADGERLERFLQVRDAFPDMKVAGVR
ncbi:MAG TPA: AMP-dependent synthetase, partial [Rhodobiaceae bacterium]|nr:AMP-dependent synthetase [Rhodobiaceae bacterium]